MPADLPLLIRLRQWLNRTASNPEPDSELVRRFVADCDESAFAALMDRHGPMVLGVARRVVGDHHTAEDIFQATFLALSRRARQLRRPAALPAWLHQTAYHLALTALRARNRRDRAEAAATRRETLDPLAELSSRELLAILDEELRRLPEMFRLPLLLCCLEGRSQDEAAALLGWTRGSVRGRLERGRQRLRERLVRRGLTLAVGAGVPLLIAPPVVAGVLKNTALQTAFGGSVAPAVAVLANAAPQPLLTLGWKVFLLVAVVGLAGAGLPWLTQSPQPQADELPAVNGVAAPAEADAQPRLDEPLARFGSSRLRIGNSDFALTPDGKTIVAVTPEGIVRKFAADDGRLLDCRQLMDRAGVSPLGQMVAQLSADGRTVALGTKEDGGERVMVYDVASGKTRFQRAAGQGMSDRRFALSPDGKSIAVDERALGRNERQILRVYDLQTGQGKTLGNLEFNVYDIRFTGDSRRVFVSQTSSDGSRSWTFACFDVAAGKQLWKLPRKGQEYAVTADGKTLISAVFKEANGFQVIETDPHSGRPTEGFKAVSGPQAHPNVRLAFLPDNRTVVMGHFEHFILWDLETGTEVRRFPRPLHAGRGYGTEFGAIGRDGRTMLTNLGFLQRWDLTTGKTLYDPPPEDGLGGPVEHLAFTADGKHLLAMSWSLQTAQWEVATGKLVGRFPKRFGHQLVSTPDGLRSVGADSYKTPHEGTVYDPAAGKPLQTVPWADPQEIGGNGLRAYALTADGKRLLVAHTNDKTASKKSFITVWEVPSGRRLSRCAAPNELYFSLSPFSPCGRWFVRRGTVYHVGTGTALFVPSGQPGEQLSAGSRWAENPIWFSNDGRLLASRLSKTGSNQVVNQDTLAVWELASGQVLARFPRTTFVSQVAFGPDGRTVAFADGRGVRIHDLLTGKQPVAYSVPDVTCDVTDRGCGTQTLAFAPDGRTLATGHRDGSVQLWKVPPLEAEPAAANDEADRLWADLGSASPGTALTAVQRLTHRPATALALLTARFRPTPTPADPQVAALLKDLDSDTFAVREEATRKLRERGPKAATTLRRALAEQPPLDKRRRIEGLLHALTTTPPVLRLPVTGVTLRGVRAIEVLERLKTPEARTLLQGWAEQSQNAHLAEEAKLALGRSGR